MQQRMSNQIKQHQKFFSYSSGTNLLNKSVEKVNTLSINPNNNSNNLFNRGNYHYNYTPNGSTQKPLEKNSIQQHQKYQRLPFHNNQGSIPKQNDNDRSYAKYAVSESKHSLQHSKYNKLNHFTQTLFPNTFKVMDLSKFIQQNVTLRKRLISELNDIKKQRKNNLHENNKITLINNQIDLLNNTKTPQKSISQSKQKQKISSKYDDQSVQQQQKEIQQLLIIKQQKQQQIQQQQYQLTQLQKKNTIKRQQIQKLQQQMLNQSIHETPLLREKQQAIEYLSVEIEWLNEKTAQLKRLTNSKFAEKNIFEMYEQMCRQCETLRKDNNKKSEKLKTLFEKTNKLTGKQENVNMFLMNLKV